MIKAALFDWDNTLVNSWKKLNFCINKTFTHFGHETWTLEQTKQNMHRSLRDWFPEKFGDKWLEAKDYYYASYHEVAKTFEVEVLEGALETIKYLNDNGIPVGIVSNKNGTYLREEIDQLKWHDYFKAVVGSGDAEKDKPSAEPAFLALKLMNLEPSDKILFIGDTIVDTDCANAAGLVPVFYGLAETGVNPNKERDYNLYSVRNHKELLEFIKAF